MKVRIPVILLGLITFMGVACAHDSHRPELNEWFMKLHSKFHVPCCSGSDATVVRDADWDTKDGHFIVRMNGNWVNVPDEAVIDDPNLDGQTLIWPYFVNGSPQVRCFMPGAGG